MASVSARNERFEIALGAAVVAEDGIAGRVEAVVVSPGTGEVTDLVIRKGLVLRRDVVVPIAAVVSADEHEVRVRLTIEELNGLPEFREEEFTRPPADWRSPEGGQPAGALIRLPSLLARRELRPARAGQTPPAAGGRPLEAGQRVFCRDGEVGPLDLVLLDPATWRATHFVVRSGELVGRDLIVPVEWVREIGRDRIFVDVGREQLERLPEYRPDDEITADVLRVLWYGSDLEPADLQDVEVRAKDGVVELSGYTRTEEARRAIEAIARGVRGVLGVRNRIESFEELAKLAEQLARG